MVQSTSREPRRTKSASFLPAVWITCGPNRAPNMVRVITSLVGRSPRGLYATAYTDRGMPKLGIAASSCWTSQRLPTLRHIRSLSPALMAHPGLGSGSHGLHCVCCRTTDTARRTNDRESHTLVTARALLTLAEDRDENALFEHINAYAEDSNLQGKTFSSLSAAAEETPGRAATARRIWPKLIRHVLDRRASTDKPGRQSILLLRPSRSPTRCELPYLYRELHATPMSALEMWRLGCSNRQSHVRG